MSDEQIHGQQVGQPVQADVNPSSDGQGTENQSSPQYVTEQQLEELEKRILSQAQSLVDKKGNAINAKIEQLKAAGITATPEQARALVEREEQVQSSANQQKVAQPNAGQGQVDPEQAKWITSAAGNAQAVNDPSWQSVYQISKMNGGMLIESTDPEIEMMNKTFESGAAFVSTFAQAIAAKTLRLSESKTPNYASSPAMFSGGQKSSRNPTNLSFHELYSRGYEGK